MHLGFFVLTHSKIIPRVPPKNIPPPLLETDAVPPQKNKKKKGEKTSK